MKQLTAALIVLIAFDIEAQPILLGEWESDKERTMRFNGERAKVEEKTVLFLSQIFGHLTVTFSDTHVSYDMPDVETETIEGKKSQLVGFRETHSYRVLGVTDNAIAVLSTEPISGSEIIIVYNFDGPNTMWVYAGGADSFAPDTHLREYFRRATQANKAMEPTR